MSKYKIDFYQISIRPTATYQTIGQGLSAIFEGTLPSTVNDRNGYTRELWRLVKRGAPNPTSWAGEFRKFRISDLPEIGRTGEASIELELEPGQGLIERNFFVLYREHGLIAWHVNGHASHPNRLADFLTLLLDAKVTIAPLIQADALERLMRNGVDLTKIEVTLPRPRAPDLFPADDFSQYALGMMNDSGADTIHFELRADLRRDKEARLTDSMKRSLSRFLGMGASTAKAFINIDGISDTIDLVADRLSSTQELDTNGGFPPSETMYTMIDQAKNDCQGAIDAYLGTAGRTLN